VRESELKIMRRKQRERGTDKERERESDQKRNKEIHKKNLINILFS
jgi:hypothetical protein